MASLRRHSGGGGAGGGLACMQLLLAVQWLVVEQAVRQQAGGVDIRARLRASALGRDLVAPDLGATSQNLRNRPRQDVEFLHQRDARIRFLFGNIRLYTRMLLQHVIMIMYLMGGVGGISMLIARFTDQHADRRILRQIAR